MAKAPRIQDARKSPWIDPSRNEAAEGAAARNASG